MLAKLSKNAGAKIVLHDPSLPPLPDEYGIDMQPNTASSIAIQTVSLYLMYPICMKIALRKLYKNKTCFGPVLSFKDWS